MVKTTSIELLHVASTIFVIGCKFRVGSASFASRRVQINAMSKKAANLISLIAGIVAALMAVVYWTEDLFENRVFYSRVVLVCCIATVAPFLFAKRDNGTNAITDFFLHRDTPLNLSIARAVVFVIGLSQVSEARALRACQNSLAGWATPFGLDWVSADPWFTETYIRIGVQLCVAFSWLAILGFLTRISVPVATLLLFYVLGLEHFDGKVDHGFHGVIWFAIILSFSPSHRGISIDELIHGLGFVSKLMLPWLRLNCDPPRSSLHGGKFYGKVAAIR